MSRSAAAIGTAKQPRPRLRARQPSVSLRLVGENEGSALHDRIYTRIRNLIVTGKLTFGWRLASSRELAETMGVSRNSVTNAIDRLISDGWLYARRGAGVYVSYRGPHLMPSSHPQTKFRDKSAVPFAQSIPAVDLFPRLLWAKLQDRRWKRMPSQLLQEGEPEGWRGLRQAIAGHLALNRGVSCTPDQIVVSTSTPAIIDLVVRALGLAGCHAWVESPGYNLSWLALKNCGVQLVGVPVDANGIDVAAGKRISPQAKFALVTAACQFPTGVMMGIERRAELLNWAREQDAWIIEDDFDWQNGSSRQPPLVCQDKTRVIYCDTFNQMLFPALRIAYALIPDSLVDRVAALRRGLDGSTNVPNQIVLADFIDGGHLDRHLARLKAGHLERRAALGRALTDELSEFIRPPTNAAGSYFVCNLRIPLEGLLRTCASHEIAIESMTTYRLLPDPSVQVILGYSGFVPNVIWAAAQRLGRALSAAGSAGDLIA